MEEKGKHKSVAEKVQDFFYHDTSLLDYFEQWCLDRAHEIDLDTEECSLRYTTLHSDFLREFENKISEFIEMEGHSLREFVDELSEAEPNSNTDLFGRILAATTDFDVFLEMMYSAARQSREDQHK